VSAASSIYSIRLYRRAKILAGLVLGACLISRTIAAENPPPPPSLSEKVVEALKAKMQPELDKKNWDGALAAVNGILATTPPDSYDTAFITDIKAKIFLYKNDLVQAIAPMEAVLRMADAHPTYFGPKTTLDSLYTLAQIYYQEGTASKDPAAQKAYLTKALQSMKRWLQTTPKKNPDASLFYASILYNQAVSSGEKVDLNLIKEARHEIDEGLLSSLKPKDSFYVLLLATIQQEGDTPKAAEILEMLVKQKPENKQYWQQLWATYLNIATATGEKDEAKIRENYARSINALERAQALGLLKDPKDNYHLVTLYFNSGQFGRATELLYAGLKNGSIESDVNNWKILGYSFQQVGQEIQAINVYKEASKLFPTNGQFDFLIGQIYSQMDTHANEAYAAYSAAVAKGNLEKPYLAYSMLAYTAYDLQRFPDALKWIDEAMKVPDAKSDSQLPRLKQFILDAVKDQLAAKEANDGKKP
jgi:hypothetical protein